MKEIILILKQRENKRTARQRQINRVNEKGEKILTNRDKEKEEKRIIKNEKIDL